MKSVNGITYSRYYGFWAALREDFLLKNKPEVYKNLVDSGGLESHLQSIQAGYEAIASKLSEQLSAQQGLSPELCEQDLLAWVEQTIEIQKEVRQRISSMVCK